MLNLFILMKRSKNTKGKAEHISFLITKGTGALAVWCSVLVLKSATGFIQASMQTLHLALHLCCCSSAQTLVMPTSVALQCGVSLTPLPKISFTQSFLVVHPLIEVPWSTQTLKAPTVQLGFTNLCVQTPLVR